MTIKNAKITSTMLGTEDHGIFTFSLMLDYGGSGQAFGMYSLDAPLHENGEFMGRFGTADGMQKIMDLLKCLKIEKWENLVGQHIRADSEHKSVRRIGHLLEDRWFAL